MVAQVVVFSAAKIVAIVEVCWVHTDDLLGGCQKQTNRQLVDAEARELAARN